MNMIKSGEQKVYVEFPNFTGRNVPIREIAEAIGKDAQYIRIGLQEGWLKFGYAKKMGRHPNSITIVRTKKCGKKQVISEKSIIKE